VKAAAVIPARWASTRFPGKSLFPVLGKPLVQHVWERCQAAKSLAEVIVATDDMRIAEAAFAFGAAVSLTSSKHQSGTDRVAEVAGRLHGFQHIINVQGDEPAVEPRLIDRLVHVLQNDPALDMVTAASPFENEFEAENPNNVKVVTARDGRALYFSRSRIPFQRDGPGSASSPALWHIGIYGYRRDFLARFVRWRPTPLERLEKLEQLRALEQGAAIRVIRTRHRALGVDTLEDVARAEGALAKRRKTIS
jgi:3-deoxy-manno-octulosonate cytidylyltransferase (CMP-KDO synthetase)